VTIGSAFMLVVAAGAGTASGPDCVTAAAGGEWQTRSYPLQKGAFTAELDATPSASPINAVVGLAALPPTEYSALATIARFNPSGQIDARNGAAFEAASPIPYRAGTRYHFRMTVDVARRKYSLFVTPAGGDERTVGVDLAFRVDQQGAASLQHWGAFTGGRQGSLQVCGHIDTDTREETVRPRPPARPPAGTGGSPR
jgi:hypothetical protein